MPTTSNITIYGFAFLSIMIHSILLLGNNHQKYELPAQNISGQINVKLNNSELSPVIKKVNIQTNSIKAQQNKNTALTEKPSYKEASYNNDKYLKSKNTISENVTKKVKLNKPEKERLSALVISRIQTRLEQYFVYPKLAQRRNWSGDVILSFFVNFNGKLDNIQIIKSSGHDILDNSAKDTLAKIKYIDIPETQIAWNGSSMHIPISYRLH